MQLNLKRPGALVAAVAAGAVLAAPLAAIAAGEGSPIRIGKRNPSNGAASKETQVIARSAINTYGTRQSNLGAGGGAIYGCRAPFGADLANPAQTTPCVRVNNLSNGLAFQFVTRGTTVGLIQAGASFAKPEPNARPFVTNATGVATGFNADKLDGRDAEQIIAEARASNPAGNAPSFAFARVAADGKTDASRSQGVTDANVRKGSTAGVYCFYGLTSRPKNAQATLDGVPGEIATDTSSNTDPACPANNVELIVRTFDSAGAPADKGFQLALTGGGA